MTMSSLRISYSALIVLLLAFAPIVFFLPLGGGAAALYGTFMGVCGGVVLVRTAWVWMREGRMELSRPIWSESLILLVMLVCASSIAAPASIGYELWGTTLEIGSGASILLFALFAYASYVKQSFVRGGVTVFVFAASAASGFATLLAIILHSTAIEWSAVGWIAAGAALMIAALLSNAGTIRTRALCAAALPAVCSLWVAGAVLPSLLSAALILILTMYERTSKRVVVLRVLIAATLISPVLLSSAFAHFRSGFADARPSTQGTVLVLAPAYLSDGMTSLIGSGPLSFSDVWNAYYPPSLNVSPLALQEQTQGGTLLITFAIEFGLLAVACLFFAYAVTVYNVFSLSTPHALDPLPIALLAYAVVGLVCDNVPAPVWYAAAIALGAVTPVAVSRSFHWSIAVRAFSFACVLAAIAFFCVSVREIVAYALHQRALAYPSASLERWQLMEQAVSAWPSPTYLRDASHASISIALQVLPIAGVETTPREAADIAQMNAQAAISLDRHSFDSWLAYASVLVSRALAGDQPSFDLARDALQQAKGRAPSRPEVPYLLAVLAHATGNTVSARTYVTEALELKSDYAPALDLARSQTATQSQ